MNIFNSLGSNYDFEYILHSLRNRNIENAPFQLQSYLKKKYRGEVVLLYKAREAIELALRLTHLPKGTEVAINGFTCYAVYRAVQKAGYTPVYIDVNEGSLHFSAEDLEKRLKKNPTIKVVIVQNTLGYSCDIEAIQALCKQYNMILIEDLAHSIGTIYENGKEAGTVGDFVICSFSQDKVIDGVSGGALIIRNISYHSSEFHLRSIGKKQYLIDRCYPSFTYIIRTLYPLGFGKIFHALLKKLHILSNPMGNQDIDDLYALPAWHCALILKELNEKNSNLEHRKKIAQVYADIFDKSLLLWVKNIDQSTNLRFPLYVKNPRNVLSYMKKQGVYIFDTWYDAPIAPKKYMHLTDYKKGVCPRSEYVTEHIINLPTHKNISIQQAKEIARKVCRWLALQ